ncbi:MAG TPA: hypothetical protein VFC65_13855 [Prolixibacteraceae bacterium]|nr:hypothetical protein [Prolixibacteraceae bacterium]
MKFLSKAIPKKKDRILYNCEMTIKTNEVDFVVIGASKVIYCNAIGPVKVSLPFWYLNDIVKRVTAYYITLDITEGFLTIGKLTVEADTCFFQDDSILRSVKLPINFTVADLLRINDRYTPEEITFNKLDVLIKKNIQTISQDVNKIAVLLKKYGITRKEIQEFVFERINYKSQTPTNHE